ncbi:hypothetical protein AGOR_G00155440 [Albula goreensis]|uniref:G-protein coupled receptors family 1 profile domain-containing protein n=1 Tax=Albula goreensis TaxID=1534307 RepID=A0A8T3D3Q7_9TELE|nr:hypothetical protein AGOR_G00155440 [Albula goreensis]
MSDISGVIYTTLEVLIAVACCLGNVLVIWAVRASGCLQQPAFCFVVSLAVADFLVGAVAIPMAVVVDRQVWTSFHGCLLMSCVVMVLIQSSVLSLLAIAVDRHLRVHIPLRYKRIITQRHSWAMVLACWLVAVVLGFIPMVGWYNHQTLAMMDNSTTIVCQFVAVMDFSYLVYFNFFGFTLLPLLVMLALYAHIFHSIHKRLREKQARSADSHAYFAKERRLAKSLLLVLVLFAACWLPLCLMNCVAFFGKPEDIPHAIVYGGILLTHANSAVNPVVYAFKIPKIHQAYLQVCRKCLWGRNTQDWQGADINNPTSGE